MATSFSGGRSRSTQREPPTMGKQLVNFITCSNLQSRVRTHAFENFTVATITWLTVICVTNNHGCVPLVVNTSRSSFVTRLTRRVPLVEQELSTFPEHLILPPVFSVTRSLVLCVCFIDRCLSFCIFFFWPCCCLFFNIRILITPLVSSNSSYEWSDIC